MSALTNHLEGRIVDHFLRSGNVASPASVHLALFTSDPGEDPIFTGGVFTAEASYTGYVRQTAVWSPLDANGQTKNTTTLTFPANGNVSASVTITHAAIMDAPGPGGNPLLYGPLASPKTLAPGDVLSFAVNALTLTLD